MRHSIHCQLPLLLLLALPAAAQDISSRFPAGSITTREQAEAALAAASKEQARIEKEFDARDAECYRRFLVNDCRETVRREREIARREVKRVELEAGNTVRLLDQQEVEQRRAVQREQREAQDQQREPRAAQPAPATATPPQPRSQPREPAADSASKPLTDEEIARNRADYEAKQKAHAERLAREQAEAATRAQNAEAYRQKQADAAKRAADSEAERKLREQRRARRAEEMKQKEAEREAIRQRAAEAAANATVR